MALVTQGGGPGVLDELVALAGLGVSPEGEDGVGGHDGGSGALRLVLDDGVASEM